ncbi:MAG: DUF234 domain-containing protein, partial [Sulfurimonas sp.]|nr:DUF234 domain-containing protein [Sulfurimonas sp.]
MPKLLNQFRSFYFRNYPDDMEVLIEYFAVFGGLGWEIDTSKPITFLIEELILQNFDIFNEKIDQLTLSKQENKRLLRALAVGDRRIFSAFNKAGLNNANGGSCLNYLQEKGIINIEYSREEPAKSLNPNGKLKREIARHRISHKVLFTQPFVRFWFYFIAPHTKDILENNYENLFRDFAIRQNSYTSLVFEELSEILLNYHLRDSQILSSGSYWDAKIEIDILTVTEDEKIFIAECKWTNHKVNKKELHKLLEKCEKLEIQPEQIIFFSKRGFSKELKSMEGKDLALYNSKD